MKQTKEYIYKVAYWTNGVKKTRTFTKENEMFKFEELCVNNNWIIESASAERIK